MPAVPLLPLPPFPSPPPLRGRRPRAVPGRWRRAARGAEGIAPTRPPGPQAAAGGKGLPRRLPAGGLPQIFLE